MAKSKRKKRGQPHQRPPKAKKPAPEERQQGRKETRADRIEAARRSQQRRSRMLRIAAMVVAAVVLGAVVVWQVTSRRAAQAEIAAMTSGSCTYDTESDPGRVGEHTPNPRYEVNPPSGGAHMPTASSAGRYDVSNAPADGRLVHSLEHGYVILWHQPGLPDDDMAVLTDLQEQNDRDVLLVARPSLDVTVAATAWQRRLLCTEVERESLARFIDAYVGTGPEKVPRG